MPTEDPEPITAPRLADLFREHRAGLAGAVRAMLGPGVDVQELLQDAFLKAWEAIRRDTFPRDPVAWVFVLTMNLARDRRRSSQRRGVAPSLEEIPEVEIQTPDANPAHDLESAEILNAARSAILGLDDGEKEVFLLRASGELTFEAAAQALDIPIGTAKSRMRSALTKLRRDLSAFAPTTARRNS